MTSVIRKQSPVNLYHVMLRGINRQQIFEDQEDYIKFIQILKKCKQLSQFQLHAFCLMGNHVHLLLEPGKESLSQIIKRITCRFVYWYNKKYDRIGHLFQGRYRSEIIETQEYFLNVVRYIHQNPIKSHLTDSLSNYPWCSYHAYTGKEDFLTDTKKVFSIFNTKEDVLDFINSPSVETYMDYDSNIRLSDLQAKKIIFEISHCNNISEFQALDKNSRNFFIAKLKQEGLSLRQISRLCGISKSTAAKL